MHRLKDASGWLGIPPPPSSPPFSPVQCASLARQPNTIRCNLCATQLPALERYVAAAPGARAKEAEVAAELRQAQAIGKCMCEQRGDVRLTQYMGDANGGLGCVTKDLRCSNI
jgi:hypothetical protein